MSAAELNRIATLCEKAAGPDRELDREIVTALHPGSEWRPYRPKACTLWLYRADGTVAHYGTDYIPAYTSSIDAALTLVPANCDWSLEKDAAWVRWMDGSEEGVAEAQCALLGRGGTCTALALSSAALRARAAAEPQARNEQVGCELCEDGWRHGCDDMSCEGANEPHDCEAAVACFTCNPNGLDAEPREGE